MPYSCKAQSNITAHNFPPNSKFSLGNIFQIHFSLEFFHFPPGPHITSSAAESDY